MLLYFILGSLFTEIVLPFITSLTEVLMTLMETIKGKLSVKISQYNKQISDLNKDTPKEEKRKSMGFLASAISDAEIEPEEEDDEDYEDD